MEQDAQYQHQETAEEFWRRKGMERLKNAEALREQLDEEKRTTAKLRWCLDRAIVNDYSNRWTGYAEYKRLTAGDLMSRYDEMLEEQEAGEEDENA